ncbi:hypothetical protein QBC33DRAFT_560662 [Phialemonium atrogriseum]|uniref:Protein ECM13 n=1 Tax=Phialemonium atrogriseum TaxID=1093897 RepID=A0AAJ0BZ60_9PEZI|nr:uncharacterized protein QBC33DRAFT_560662 [Phialemonium atrogriseum]KAK1765742.1 hypothetical protein QBC33DRAFT_560662 [Phialemonium atrogriseum]
MSITQTYFLAHKARAKLSHEAARPDHDLRLLVGHANLLDSLMLDLADAEREQESWFNQSVSGATKSQDRHIRWADTVEEPEEDWQAEDADSDLSSDSDSDFDDEDVEMADVVSLRRVPSNNKPIPTLRHSDYDDEVEEDDDEEEDFAHLTLTRSPSHSASPPELDHDSDSSEDESMPPSPPTALLPTFTQKQKKSDDTTSYYEPRQEAQGSFYAEGFYLPPRNPARLVSAISVY